MEPSEQGKVIGTAGIAAFFAVGAHAISSVEITMIWWVLTIIAGALSVFGFVYSNRALRLEKKQRTENEEARDKRNREFAVDAAVEAQRKIRAEIAAEDEVKRQKMMDADVWSDPAARAAESIRILSQPVSDAEMERYWKEHLISPLGKEVPEVRKALDDLYARIGKPKTDDAS